MKRILLAGGGTAGHIMPNIALLPYLKNFEIHYAGQAGGMEEEILRPYEQVDFHPIACVKLRRSLTIKNAAVPFKLIKGVRQAKKLIAKLNPAVVFSKGGFAALPVMLAAKKKTPLLLHESDFSMGLANRLAAKKCRYVCCTFSSLAEKFPNGIFTGTPLRQELYFGDAQKAARECGMPAGDRADAASRSPTDANGKKNLLIVGGSQGAAAVNEAVFAAVNELCAYFNIVHVVGKKNDRKIARPGYFQLEYCENMSDYYAWTDFALSRGGANAVSELVALKIPSLIVPLPKSGSSRGDQEDNARYYEELGCVRVLKQDSLTAGTLVSELSALVGERNALLAAMNKAPSPDGTRKIAELLNRF